MVDAKCPVCDLTIDLSELGDGDLMNCPQCGSPLEVQRRERRWTLVSLEEEELDEFDLTQLPGVDMELQRKLNECEYDTLWEIALADVDELAEVGEIDVKAVKKMIATARKLLRFEEE